MFCQKQFRKQPNDIIVYCIKLKAFADHRMIVTEKPEFALQRWEIWWKKIKKNVGIDIFQKSSFLGSSYVWFVWERVSLFPKDKILTLPNRYSLQTTTGKGEIAL